MPAHCYRQGIGDCTGQYLENTALNQMGCWRHLREDVQRWLAVNLPRVKRNRYVNEKLNV